MPDNNTNPTPNNTTAAPPAAKKADNSDVISSVIEKINDAQNILIALSGNPSVDEMAAAIGLSLFLDKLNKRATAIYSGATPNALEFLKPEETLEPTIDALQDFVIALSKEKADHLRYKLDGDFVKIFITPYRTRISEEDLDYSYGDYNIDLVLALDVANGADLDGALREHGRIMHDAVIVDITTGNPGKLGEIEWTDKSASSVSEMIAHLIYQMEDKDKFGKEEATALLTGIVAATNRFSNAKTTAEVMRMASRLMESGADQQLISKNITADTQNEIFNLMGNESKKSEAPQESQVDTDAAAAVDVEELPSDTPEKSSEEVEGEILKIPQEDDDPGLLEDLKAAEETLAKTGAEATPEVAPETLKIDSNEAEPTSVSPEVPAPAPEAPTAPEPSASTEGTSQESFISDRPEKVIQPSSSMTDPLSADSNKYERMVEDALAGISSPSAMSPAPMPPQPAPVSPMANPAANFAPAVPTNPEINGIPQMNYMPMPGDAVLPPPPTPPIDMSASSPQTPAMQNNIPAAPPAAVTPIAPATPPSESASAPLGAQPAMQDQVYGAQAANPGTFRIPGM